MKDKLNEPLQGTFYEAELQPVDYDPKGEFFIKNIEKVVKNKGKKNEIVEVSWYGWPKKFNQQIYRKDIVNYEKK